ncbi:MAG: homoserine dehydrogenase [Pseudomonadales bacterium]|nr:homoserine dehydrogenase [Pseudomonadales bacterium]
MKSVNVGLAGLGTVGSGTFNILTRNATEIERRVGRSIHISQIGARRDNPACDTSQHQVTRDIFDVAKNPDVDILVELIGGTSVAKELVLSAIENGKHVVTANKALIAEHGNEIFSAAASKGVNVLYEAAVAGGIPIIKALREGLAANRIEWIAGIINGTGNFILTEMQEKGREFSDVLSEAQDLGYAEADPTFDVEGIDAAHKLTIIASIAFGIPLQFDAVFTEGISKITPADIEYADQLGYRIKHLGLTRRSAGGIELRVHPTLIPKNRLIANVNGVMNAVLVKGDAVGPTLYYGAGAGDEATGSAVVADIVDLARILGCAQDHNVPALGFVKTENTPILSVDLIYTCYYLRIEVQERPGVLAEITKILSEQNISIEAVLQKEVHQEGRLIPIIILTHRVLEKDMNDAISKIQALDEVEQEITRIRLEHLDAG